MLPIKNYENLSDLKVSGSVSPEANRPKFHFRLVFKSFIYISLPLL